MTTRGRSGTVAAVAVLALATLVAMAWVVGGAWPWARAGSAAGSRATTRDVAVRAGQTLDLAVEGASSVVVRDGTPGRVDVRAAGRGWQGRWSPRILVTAGPEGPVVRVAPSNWAWWWLTGGWLGTRVRVAVPARVSLRVSDGTGALWVSGTHPRAALRVAAGSVTVADYRGALSIVAVNGDVRVTRAVVAGGFSAVDTNGNVALAGVTATGGAAAVDVNGGVTAAGLRVGGSLTASDVNGDVALSGVAASRFTLHTVNGDIRYVGSGGSGGSATTVNGSVRLRLLAPGRPGHYTVVTPGGVADWPSSSGPTLGAIALTSGLGGVAWGPAAPATAG